MSDIVARYAKEKQIPLDVAREHEQELKRFLALCAIKRDAAYGMAGPVDDLWHTFIIFTREYESFCRSVAGFFLHHVPNTNKSSGDSASYDAFLSDYLTMFGEEAPKHIWPRFQTNGSDGADCSEGGCGRCNKCKNCTGGAASCKACEGCGWGN
jgi:hypothetical protein